MNLTVRIILFVLVVLVQIAMSRTSGADPVPVKPIRFLPGPTVQPPPPPAPDPTAVAVLTAETLDVIDSDVDVQVDAFPAGLVKITTEAGPLKIRGHFLDSPKTLETRLFKGKQVVTIEAVPNASGPVTVVVIPPGATSPSQWERKRIDVGQGPRPPPGPAPTPAPGPAPAPGAKLFGVVVADRLNLDPAQAAALASPAFRAYLTAAGHELDQLDTRTTSTDERAKLTQYQPFVTQAKIPAGTAALVLVDAAGPTKGLVRSVVAVPTSDAALIGTFKSVVGP